MSDVSLRIVIIIINCYSYINIFLFICDIVVKCSTCIINVYVMSLCCICVCLSGVVPSREPVTGKTNVPSLFLMLFDFVCLCVS